jgi:lysophospholipase L1-like esterase
MRNTVLLLLTLVVISCSPAKKYRTSPDVLAWEKEIRRFEKLDSTEQYPSDAIMFTGSSSIVLWKTLEKDMAPYHVINRGFGGSKLSDFAVYGERIIAPHPCSAIVIFIGNDISGGPKDKSPAEVAGLFRYLLKTIRKSHPETAVFWIAITPTPSRWKVWPQQKEANELIRKICDREANTYFISTEASFIGSDGKPYERYFRPDMLHLNDEGYKIWSRIIKKEISKVVPYPG